MICEKIVKIIAAFIEKSVAEIDLDTTFDQLNIDSLGLIDIIMDVESEFYVTIDDNEKINTPAELVAAVSAVLS